jgi:methylase of polypeptide subunit release factors
MESINHHTLSDFRVDHREALDELFTQVLGLLSHEGLITLERVMQDGTKVRAQAQANTFCKEDRIRQDLDAARHHIQTMGDPKQAPHQITAVRRSFVPRGSESKNLNEH